MIDVARMIATIRKERGYSQLQLANKLGLTKQAISNYERGLREPDYVTLEAIADVLNVPMHILMSQEDQERALNGIYETYENSQQTVTSELTERTERFVQGFNRLQPDKQAAVLAVIDTFLKEQELHPGAQGLGAETFQSDS